uniref:Uncharacterized protein n=1 Tax=Oryza meridionalis TaxID=40149 RepID=A0A0E0DME6_9ORYZ
MADAARGGVRSAQGRQPPAEKEEQRRGRLRRRRWEQRRGRPEFALMPAVRPFAPVDLDPDSAAAVLLHDAPVDLDPSARRRQRCRLWTRRSNGGGPWLTSTPIRPWTGSDWGDRSSPPLPGTDLGPCRAQPCRAPAADGRGQLLLLLGARAALLLLRADEAVEVAVGLEADHEGTEAVLALHLALAEERDGLAEAAEARLHGEVVGRHGHGEGAAALEQLLHRALMVLPRGAVVIGE